MNKIELAIEIEIHNFLKSKWIRSWTNDIKWYFNKEAWLYVKNTNPYIARGISDISFLYKGQFVCIEVKKPSEMNAADKDLETLKQEFIVSQVTWQCKATQKKKKHKFEQRYFLDNIILDWWIWFFASSVFQVKERLEKFNFEF